MDGRTHYKGCWRDHLECAVARVERLSDFVSDYAEEPCEYGDGCTNDAMHLRRHYRCLPCKARAALKN